MNFMDFSVDLQQLQASVDACCLNIVSGTWLHSSIIPKDTLAAWIRDNEKFFYFILTWIKLAKGKRSNMISCT